MWPRINTGESGTVENESTFRVFVIIVPRKRGSIQGSVITLTPVFYQTFSAFSCLSWAKHQLDLRRFWLLRFPCTTHKENELDLRT